MMTRTAMLALVCVGASGLAIAQTQTPPSDTSTQPAPREAPATGTSKAKPSSASSPHQREVTGKESDEMKSCIAKERAANSSMSQGEAKKACKEQMKSSAQH
jgi:hypothetical protein